MQHVHILGVCGTFMGGVAAIAREAGFRVTVEGDLGAAVTRSWSDAPVEQVVRAIAAGHSLILVQGVLDNGTVTLSSLRVTGRDGAGDRRVARRVAPEAGAPAGNPAAPGEADDDELEATLRLELEADQRGRRLTAIRKVADLSPERAVELLQDLVWKDEDKIVRHRAIAQLGRIGGDGVVQALGRMLMGSKDANLRRLVLPYLGAQRTEAAKAFVQSAAKDSDPNVRRTAQRMLAGWK